MNKVENNHNLFYALPLDIHVEYLKYEMALTIRRTSKAGNALIDRWSMEVFGMPLKDRMVYINVVAEHYDFGYEKKIQDEDTLINNIKSTIQTWGSMDDSMLPKINKYLNLSKRFLIKQDLDTTLSSEEIKFIKKIIDKRGHKISFLQSLKALVIAVKCDSILCDAIIKKIVEPALYRMKKTNHQKLLASEYEIEIYRKNPAYWNDINHFEFIINGDGTCRSEHKAKKWIHIGRDWEKYKKENRSKFVEHENLLRSLMAYRSLNWKIQDFLETSLLLKNNALISAFMYIVLSIVLAIYNRL